MRVAAALLLLSGLTLGCGPPFCNPTTDVTGTLTPAQLERGTPTRLEARAEVELFNEPFDDPRRSLLRIIFDGPADPAGARHADLIFGVAEISAQPSPSPITEVQIIDARTVRFVVTAAEDWPLGTSTIFVSSGSPNSCEARGFESTVEVR